VSGAAGPARAALAVALGLAALALAPAKPTQSGVDAPGTLRGPQALLFGEPVDANRADRATLEVLPGIGPGKASAWVEERTRKPFCGPADLARVKGIGPKTRARLEGLLFYESSKRCGARPGRPIDL
jgi:DNA uptake protein ComE-like DNA-binding protein